ncbi:malonate transporter subunit MadM [Planctomycetia bacterium]|nr:malonate transporter subunit MadM [Planctomycetia bacterium]
MQLLNDVLTQYNLLTAFVFVGLLMLAAEVASQRLTGGRIHPSAIAIALGLLLAGLAGWYSGGTKGVADVPLLAGTGLLGGAMLRDLSIVATAFSVRADEFLRNGLWGALSLALGLFTSFATGAVIAWLCGYRDAVSITTIAAGAATYIVGPVTGTALNASSDVIALSVAAGLVKAVTVMLITPFVASAIRLDTPRAAMIFGGLQGTNSGVIAGLAATNPQLVPYGAMTATFYTGLGCLLGPSVVFLTVRAVLAVVGGQ